MKKTIHHVRELQETQRSMLEQLLGYPLRANEELVIQVTTAPDLTQESPTTGLPGWCNVFEGLSEEEIAEIEQIALQRANLSAGRE